MARIPLQSIPAEAAWHEKFLLTAHTLINYRLSRACRTVCFRPSKGPETLDIQLNDFGVITATNCFVKIYGARCGAQKHFLNG